MSFQYKIYFPKIIVLSHQPLVIENNQLWLIPFCALSVKQPLRFGEETGNSAERKRPLCHKYAYICLNIQIYVKKRAKFGTKLTTM